MKKRRIKIVDVSEVIKMPKEPALIDNYPDAPHIRRTPENDEARASYWPVSIKTVLENIDDAHFKSLKEALE